MHPHHPSYPFLVVSKHVRATPHKQLCGVSKSHAGRIQQWSSALTDRVHTDQCSTQTLPLTTTIIISITMCCMLPTTVPARLLASSLRPWQSSTCKCQSVLSAQQSATVSCRCRRQCWDPHRIETRHASPPCVRPLPPHATPFAPVTIQPPTKYVHVHDM